MCKRPINRRWTRSVVGDKHHLSEVQLLNHCVEVPHLIGCGVGVPCGFIGSAPPKKIKCHDPTRGRERSEEHTSELQSRVDLVCRLLLEKKKNMNYGLVLQIKTDTLRSH